MMGLVNNYDGVEWRIKEMAQMLANPGARRSSRGISSSTLSSRTSPESSLTLKKSPDASQAHFRAFIAALAPVLHSAGLKLMIALPARDDAYDYEFFGKQCDAIVLMNYDQQLLTSPPGPTPLRTGLSRTCARYSTSFLRKKLSWNCELRLRLAPKFQKWKRKPQRSSASRKLCCTSRNQIRTSNSTAIR